jgi:hypothetical protein
MRDRPWRLAAHDECRLGFFGQQQSAQAAHRVGQRRGNGVQAVQPHRAARRVRVTAEFVGPMIGLARWEVRIAASRAALALLVRRYVQAL